MKIQGYLKSWLLPACILLGSSICNAFPFAIVDEQEHTRSHYEQVITQEKNKKLLAEIDSFKKRISALEAMSPQNSEESIDKIYIYYGRRPICPIPEDNFEGYLKENLSEYVILQHLQSIKSDPPADIKESLTLFVVFDNDLNFDPNELKLCGEITDFRCILTRVAKTNPKTKLAEPSREAMNAAKHFYLHDMLDFRPSDFWGSNTYQTSDDYTEFNERTLDMLKLILDGSYPSEAPYGWRPLEASDK